MALFRGTVPRSFSTLPRLPTCLKSDPCTTTGYLCPTELFNPTVTQEPRPALALRSPGAQEQPLPRSQSRSPIAALEQGRAPPRPAHIQLPPQPPAAGMAQARFLHLTLPLPISEMDTNWGSHGGPLAHGPVQRIRRVHRSVCRVRLEVSAPQGAQNLERA